MGLVIQQINASKYSDIASGGEIFISDNVFKQMSDEYREVFVKSAKYKGMKVISRLCD